MVEQAYTPSTQEVNAGDGVQGHPLIYNRLETLDLKKKWGQVTLTETAEKQKLPLTVTKNTDFPRGTSMTTLFLFI